MTPITDLPVRAYRSGLRAEQAETTRSRILDACVAVMARGVASVSVPAVAREAGVSVPTVYRHFGTKADLLAAVYPHLARRAGLGEVVVPRSVEGFRELVRHLSEGLGSFDDLARAAIASPAGEEARRVMMPERVGMSRRFVAAVAPAAAAEDRERIARVMVVLTMLSALRVWRDHLGANPDEIADDVVWVLRAAIAAATPEQQR